MAKSTTTVTIDEALLQQARNMNINISAAAEHGLRAEVKSLEEEKLKKLYRKAAKELDEHAEKHGLFSEGMRLF
ncbi:type II toxin-antitoxin system CcdA family antitoxin [Endozoicomonas numazuensis]|uniref:Acetoacetyl-CoA synthase n=1 Tax=Endozoicomonas numazuensis TaxID=1137799 RepID=A0A081NHN4_9GAMM|nr:type II toxin-antitoxin system CcdA family antitoxin [Endozoicomonas numazuensis]KEQ17957.1 hypothetical protein GZ78_10095 [Endozoicomonas numazuensis]